LFLLAEETAAEIDRTADDAADDAVRRPTWQ
jgi:hypothetical protein